MSMLYRVLDAILVPMCKEVVVLLLILVIG